MTRHVKPVDIRQDSEPAERQKRAHADAIGKLQSMPAASLEVISDVLLKNTVQTTIAHPLGRVPKWIGVSAIRGAATSGVIQEYRDGSFDRTKFISLRALNFGADITVDLVVL